MSADISSTVRVNIANRDWTRPGRLRIHFVVENRGDFPVFVRVRPVYAEGMSHMAYVNVDVPRKRVLAALAEPPQPIDQPPTTYPFLALSARLLPHEQVNDFAELQVPFQVRNPYIAPPPPDELVEVGVDTLLLVTHWHRDDGRGTADAIPGTALFATRGTPFYWVTAEWPIDRPAKALVLGKHPGP